MSEEQASGRVSAGFKAKRMVVSTSLLALATAFELASKKSAELKTELADWREGLVFSLGVLPDGPAVALKKEGGALKYLGKGHHDSELKVLFKNMDSALLPLTGQIGAHTAFAQHRAIVHGSLYEAMQVNRAMVLVQKFLMPGLILKKTSKRPPQMSGSDYLVKAYVMIALAPGLLFNLTK